MPTVVMLTEFKRQWAVAGQYYDWFNTPETPAGVRSVVVAVDTGANFSSSHKRSRDGKYRDGGSWLMVKDTVRWFGGKTTTYRGGSGIAYKGSYKVDSDFNYADLGKLEGLTTKEEFYQRANSYGAQAYHALKPDLPDFSPVVSLLELKDLPNQLKSRFQKLRKDAKRRRAPKKIRFGTQFANDYVASMFGWLPLFYDTVNFLDAFEKRKKRFDQMLRDEKKGVRRRRNLHKVGNDVDWMTQTRTNYGTSYHPSMEPVHVTQCYTGAGAFSDIYRKNFTKVWCAGKSHYFLPPGPRDDKWKARLMRRVLGLRMQPNTIYNIIPWSWLVDYFTTLGSFFDAVSSNIADRVVFDYAYVMHHEEAQHKQYSEQGIFVSKSKGGRVGSLRVKTQVRKTRIKATPLGFGLSQESLTPFQVSILGALGYSKL